MDARKRIKDSDSFLVLKGESQMRIGKKIKELRNLLGITQNELAQFLSISHQSISKWEKGIALPSILYVVPLARFFGITVSDLFEEDVFKQKVSIKTYV